MIGSPRRCIPLIQLRRMKGIRTSSMKKWMRFVWCVLADSSVGAGEAEIPAKIKIIKDLLFCRNMWKHGRKAANHLAIWGWRWWVRPLRGTMAAFTRLSFISLGCACWVNMLLQPESRLHCTVFGCYPARYAAGPTIIVNSWDYFVEVFFMCSKPDFLQKPSPWGVFLLSGLDKLTDAFRLFGFHVCGSMSAQTRHCTEAGITVWGLGNSWGVYQPAVQGPS